MLDLTALRRRAVRGREQRMVGRQRMLLAAVMTRRRGARGGWPAARDEPAAAFRPTSVDVAGGRVQVNVPRMLEQLVEARRPAVEWNRLGAHTVDDLDGGPAPQIDGRGGDAVRDQLPPVAAERQLTQLVHQHSV